MVGLSRRGRIRRLTSDEIAAYDVLSTELASRVRVIRVPALPGRYVGLTVGRFIFLARDVGHGTSSLLAHELVHVRQWHELGAIGFLYRYLADFVRGLRTHRRWNAAYRDIGAECEARSEAADWVERVGRAGNVEH